MPEPPAPGSNPYGFYHVLAPSDVEFCFWVQLDRFPEPPAPESFHTNKNTVFCGDGNAFLKESDSSGVFSIQNFVSVIPSFFVPVDELLRDHLEGYTTEHVDMYFAKARGVQVVSIGGRQFIRIFGGHAKIDMSESREAEAAFARYKIDPSLAAPFVRCFEGITNRWMPLRMLIERAGRNAAEALPFHGPASLLFFAQLQHIFAFAPDNGGAVQLRDPGYTGLDEATSPCPVPFVSLLEAITPDEKHELSNIIGPSMSDEDKADLLRFFPSLEAAIAAHGVTFYIQGASGMVMRTRLHEREKLKQLPLEAQLEIAIQARDRRKVRVLRRKIQTRNNPDNPLFDKDNVAREVYNSLPKRGYVTLLNLTRKGLPVELLDFLGNDHIRFFKNYPQYFQIFELREATRWCVARSGVQLPQGVLRTTYTEEELIRIIAAVIQRRGTMPCVRISLYIPDGCRELVRKHYVSIYHVCCRYPQYFALMKRSETKMAELSAMVSLLAMPLEGASVDADVGFAVGGATNENAAGDAADEYVGEDGEGGLPSDT